MRFRSDPAKHLRGSFAAMFTPFTPDGGLDLAGLSTMVSWQISSGSHGVTMGGSTSEPSAQTVAERAEAIRTVASAVADTVPFLAGTGSANLAETLELTSAAEASGADAAMIITPYYAKPTQEGLYSWFARIATEFPGLPLIIYNVPSRTCVDMAPETIARLFHDFENIVGIKETTKDFEHFSKVMALTGPEFLVFSGIELLCLPLLALGGAGFISALATIAPAASARMFNAWEAGDFATAREIHFGVHPLVDLLFVETNPAPAKWLMTQRGLIASSHVRAPLVTPTSASQQRIMDLAAAGSHFLTTVGAEHHV